MKQFLRLVAAFLLLSSWQSSRLIAVPYNNFDTTQDQTDSQSKHVGSVELVGKTEFQRLRTMALSSSQKTLLVSDGSIISENGIDLEVLSLTDLKRIATFSITDEMSGKYPWSSNSLSVGPNGSKVLLYNQYLDLKTMRSITSLDIRPVIGRPNVYPVPKGISPNGKMALVGVGSYMDTDESTLAVFDLETGQSVKQLSKGKDIGNGCACFLNNNTVVSVRYDGVVAIHGLSGTEDKILPEKISPAGPWKRGRNLFLRAIDGGKRLAIAARDEIVVLNIVKQTVEFRHTLSDGNPVVTRNDKLIAWQSSRRKKPLALKETEHLLLVADAQTGKMVGEYLLPTFYQMLILDDAAEYLYAAHYNELHKLKIDLSLVANR